MIKGYDTVWPDTVYVHRKDDLLLLNYTQKVQYKNLWTPFEKACRGLIIHQRTGEVVARPFDKFFNWGENGHETNAKIKTVSEKMDGSLGIHYRKHRKEVAITTRGDFESRQAIWATEHLNENYDIRNLPIGWTLLFEIIYSGNRVVIDYEGWEGLVLLAIRNRFNGKYLPEKIVKSVANGFNFRLPQRYEFSNYQDIIEETKKLPVNKEGWVVEFNDGQLFKFKGEEYKKLHKILSGITFKSILDHHQEGTIDQVKDCVPDEFHKEIDEWNSSINDTITLTTKHIEDAYNVAPKNTRKDYAVWVKKHAPTLVPYLFARLDNKEILPLIYKVAFNKKKEEK